MFAKKKGAVPRRMTPRQKNKPVEVVTSNKFEALQTHQTQESEDDTEATAENHDVIRPPPPITIDNVDQSSQLLKKLQAITKQKMRGKIIGKGLRVYPETPEAYQAIRRYVDAEKLESFIHQLDGEKDLKAVIRGMPSNTPPQEIIDDLLTYGITVNVCHAMANRKTGMPMPLFLVILPRSDINRNIFNLTDLCYLKIKVEPLRPKIGPAQCFRCHGLFHSSKFCTRNPKCGQSHLSKNCDKPADTDATAREITLPPIKQTTAPQGQLLG
ncbi:nucleic-acid-binding protein from transposon X-element [Trichonephila clavipes]|nr:nucleic-acid-binding protein from transposon X-element [Trichonephila clavipes]